ncbi:MAG TPA: protein phosphatase 2C domain-containing protein [Pyrinomonadaceae bacterium]
MNADSAFQIGASHAVCQDYSLAWSYSQTLPRAKPGWQTSPYVILADGCSSSPDTDIGARLLVKAAEQTLLELGRQSPFELSELHKEAARRALAWAQTLGLPAHAVDATLLTAHLDGDELVVGCTGDGVICFQSVTGAIDVYSISYTSGYPLYPSYAHQPERLLALEDAGRTGRDVKHFRCASIEEPLRLRDTSTGGAPTEVFTVRALDYKYVTLFSDGVHSFCSAKQTETSKRVEAVPLDEVLRGLVSFKSTRGAFVGRRLKSFLKDCQTRGWKHMDDLAVGALYLGD